MRICDVEAEVREVEDLRQRRRLDAAAGEGRRRAAAEGGEEQASGSGDADDDTGADADADADADAEASSGGPQQLVAVSGAAPDGWQGNTSCHVCSAPKPRPLLSPPPIRTLRTP